MVIGIDFSSSSCNASPMYLRLSKQLASSVMCPDFRNTRLGIEFLKPFHCVAVMDKYA